MKASLGDSLDDTTAEPASSSSGPSVRKADRAAHRAGGLFSASQLNQAMGLYLPATAAFRLINFGRILLLTWWMTRQQFGLLMMILLAVNVLTPLCSLGLNEAVTRYVPQYEARGALRDFLRRSFALVAGITLLSILSIWAFAERLGVFFYAQFTDPAAFASFKADAPELARLSALVIAILIAYFYLLAVLKGLRMFVALAVMEIVHGLIFLAATLGAVLTGHLSALTLTALYGISLLLPVILFGLGLVRSVSNRTTLEERGDDPEWAGKLLRFSVWTTIAGITWQAMVYYPTWFLNKMSGHEAVAVFSAVRQIGQFILIGAVAVVTVVMTTVTRTWETAGRQAAERQLSLAFRGTGLGLVFLCGLLSLARDLIILMFRGEYASGADVLPLHLLFFLIGAYLAFLPIHFHLNEKTRHLFWPWALGVATNVLLAFWLAGPGLATVKGSAIWRAAAPQASRLFVIGFSDPQGLGNAAWCGVLAIAVALVLCIVLVRTECVRLDRGTWIVVAAAGLLALNSLLLTVGLILLLAATLGTELILTAAERRRVMGYIKESLSHFLYAGVLGRRRHDV